MNRVAASVASLSTLSTSEVDLTTQLRAILDGDQYGVRNSVRRLIDHDHRVFETPNAFSSLEEERKFALDRAKVVAAAQLVHLDDILRNPIKLLAWFETLSFMDHNVVLKFVVNWNLWGGCIELLGSQAHQSVVDGTTSLDILGVFGLTELGHGSNVADMETLAVVDTNGSEPRLLIHTPTETAQKYWPGNMLYGHYCALFARLVVPKSMDACNDPISNRPSKLAAQQHAATLCGGNASDYVDKGVHCFFVPIRPINAELGSNTFAGVETTDLGHKIAYNGIDNGTLSFNRYALPLSALMDRFSGFFSTPGGLKYKRRDPKSSESGHFGVSCVSMCFQLISSFVQSTFSVFIGGRISGAIICLGAVKSALHNSICFAMRRRQFLGDADEEVRLIDYTTHQFRLLCPLARVYSADFAIKRLCVFFERFMLDVQDQMRGTFTEQRIPPSATKYLHVLSSALKAVVSWDCFDTLNECRQALGGQGFLTRARAGKLAGEVSMWLTGEGDGTALLQQLSKWAVATFPKSTFESRSGPWVHFFPDIVVTSDLQRLMNLHDAVLKSLMANLGPLPKSGVPKFSAWNANLPLSQQLARLHVRIFTCVCALHQARSGPAILSQIADLDIALTTSEFALLLVEHHLFDANTAAIIQNRIPSLCGDLAKVAFPLVEAFGIPRKLQLWAEPSNSIDCRKQ